MVACVTEKSVVVSRVNFLAFMVEVLSGLKQTKNNSDVVRSVVQAAERVLGMGGWNHLLSTFAREKRVVRSERDREDVDDC